MHKHVSFIALLTTFCFFLPSFIWNEGVLYAQHQGQAGIDSILKELPKQKEDTNKVRLLNYLSYSYSKINVDSGEKYGTKALQLAEKLSWGKGIAAAHNSLGINYQNRSDFTKALDYFSKALKLNEELGDKNAISNTLINIGIIYRYKSNQPKALECFLKALKSDETDGNKNGMATAMNNIGVVFEQQSDYQNALEYHFKALKLYESLNDNNGIASSSANIGIVYWNQKKYSKALEYHFNALKKYEELGYKTDMGRCELNIGLVYLDLKDYVKALEYFFNALHLFSDKNSAAIAWGNIGETYMKLAQYIPEQSINTPLTHLTQKEALHNAIVYTDSAIGTMKEIGNLYVLLYFYHNLSQIDSMLGDNKGALEAYKQYTLYHDSVFSNENKQKIFNLETKRQLELKDKQIEIDHLAIAKKRNERVFFGIGILGLLSVIIFIARERKRSEILLLNILPRKIAARLKKKEHPIADHFNEASIMFIDMEGFTRFTEGRDPKETVSALDDVFTRFDSISEKYGLEKIKTIGDCYMAVAGLPEPQSDHARRAAAMALDVKEALRGYTAKDGTPMHFRIGLDCGPVVAGVIGKKKFIYDLWGSAVNTASRMESMGVAGEIHCTDNFKNVLSNTSLSFGEGRGEASFTSRGIVSIKGKGQMETWLLS